MSFLLLMLEESNKHFNLIEFINEKLKVVKQNKFNYLLKKISFCSLLTTCTLKGTIIKRAISFFCSPPKLSIVYPHPVMKSRPPFFPFYSVHILKCIRNNWLGKKDANRYMLFTKFCQNRNNE